MNFFFGSVEISDYLDNLWHLLIHWERWWGGNKAGTGRKCFTKRQRQMQQEQRIAVDFLFRFPPPCFQIRESSIQNLTWNFLTWVLGDCYSQYEVPRYWGLYMIGCFRHCWPRSQWVAFGISISSITSRDTALLSLIEWQKQNTEDYLCCHSIPKIRAYELYVYTVMKKRILHRVLWKLSTPHDHL